jgi:hypothetical protein
LTFSISKHKEVASNAYRYLKPVKNGFTVNFGDINDCVG